MIVVALRKIVRLRHRGQLCLGDAETEEHSFPEQATAVSATGNEIEVEGPPEPTTLVHELLRRAAVDIRGADRQHVMHRASRGAALDDDRRTVAVGVGAIRPKDRATGDVVAGKAHRYSKDVRMPGRDIDGTIRARRQPADHSILPVRGGAVVLIDESDQLE